jgi:Fructose-2,6-bisphosphatase
MQTEKRKTRRLYLIRHGQAGGEKYNELTAPGRAQADALGEYFASRNIAVHAAATGSLERQRETYERFASAYSKARPDAPAPEARVVPGLDEIGPEIWFRLGEELRHKDDSFRDDFRAWTHSMRDSVDRRDPAVKAAYLRVLETVFRVWVSGKYATNEIETFQTFHKRVLTAATELPPEGDLVVISSGTPIALLTGAALGFDLERSLYFTRRVANTSLSVYETKAVTGESSAADRWDPISINGLPHLSAEQATEI